VLLCRVGFEQYTAVRTFLTDAATAAAQVDGLHLRVDMATGASGTAGAKTYSRGRSIFVGNLHFAAQVMRAALPAWC